MIYILFFVFSQHIDQFYQMMILLLAINQTNSYHLKHARLMTHSLIALSVLSFLILFFLYSISMSTLDHFLVLMYFQISLQNFLPVLLRTHFQLHLMVVQDLILIQVLFFRLLNCHIFSNIL